MSEERLTKVLLSPIITEKSAGLADANNQFAFRVVNDATKPEIKAAVEKLFEVEVANVQVANIKGKKKRFGAVHGRRSDSKKAYVTLKPGHDIDFMGQG